MNLNTESIVNDVTKVVQNGLKDILSEIETKYKLYEESHKCVVKMAECMSKQVKQEGTSATTASATTASATTASSTTASATTASATTASATTASATTASVVATSDNYVSRTEFNALAKQNQELMKHIAYEFESHSKQNQEVMKQLAIIKQDMAKLLSRDNESDDETKANITLNIEEIKKETIDNLIGGALDDKVNVVAGDKQEEDSEEEEESEEEEDSEEEEESEEEEPVVPTEKHVLVSTTSVSAALEVEEEEEKEEEEEEEEESDEEKEQLDDDDKGVEDAGGEEEELYEIVFNSTTYCTDDDVKGSLYILTSDGDVGDKVGHLVNGKPIFY